MTDVDDCLRRSWAGRQKRILTLHQYLLALYALILVSQHTLTSWLLRIAHWHLLSQCCLASIFLSLCGLDGWTLNELSLGTGVAYVCLSCLNVRQYRLVVDTDLPDVQLIVALASQHYLILGLWLLIFWRRILASKVHIQVVEVLQVDSVAVWTLLIDIIKAIRPCIFLREMGSKSVCSFSISSKIQIGRHMFESG